MIFSITLYCIVFIMVLFFSLHPKISMNRDYKKEYHYMHQELQSNIAKKIIQDNFSNYTGQTRVFFQNSYEKFLEMQEELTRLSKGNHKGNMKGTLDKLNQLNKKYNVNVSNIDKVKEKEKEVYEYISKLKLKLVHEESEKLQKELRLLEETVSQDILQAYDYMNYFDNTTN